MASREQALEDALMILWQEATISTVAFLRDEYPQLLEFMSDLHQIIEHEQVETRHNVWRTKAAESKTIPDMDD